MHMPQLSHGCCVADCCNTSFGESAAQAPNEVCGREPTLWSPAQWWDWVRQGFRNGEYEHKFEHGVVCKAVLQHPALRLIMPMACTVRICADSFAGLGELFRGSSQ